MKVFNKFIYGGVCLVVILIAFLVYDNIYGLDESEIERFETAIYNDTELMAYFDFVYIVQDEDKEIFKQDGYKFVSYIISGNGNKKFDKLSD